MLTLHWHHMPLGVGQGQNVGLGDFCHSLTLLPPGASVFHKHMSSCIHVIWNLILHLHTILISIHNVCHACQLFSSIEQHTSNPMGFNATGIAGSVHTGYLKCLDPPSFSLSVGL